MSNESNFESETDASQGSAEAGERIEDLRARLALLSEENRRLRAEYQRARAQTYKRTGLALFALGLLAGGGAVLFPGSREVLVSLAGVGVFAAVLVYYLTPERFIAVSVGEQVYDAYARSATALVSDLGLRDERIYVPADENDVRLFVPNHAEYEIPQSEELDHAVVAPEDERGRGLSFSPTGDGLYREFERSLAGQLAVEPAELAEQLADGLVETFELADSAVPEIDREEGRISVGIEGSAYGRGDGFDHPVGSFVATGLVRGLGVPVELTVDRPEDDRIDFLVTCSWEAEQAPDDGA